jgi:hypothetical protein
VKEKKLHMVGNAHLDPVWLWQWHEGFQEVKSTFRSALRLHHLRGHRQSRCRRYRRLAGAVQSAQAQVPGKPAAGQGYLRDPLREHRTRGRRRGAAGQGWIDLSGISPQTGESYGLSILNDGKYGYDVKNEEIGLTVLRSPIYAHHDPFVPQPDESYAFVDQGIHG